MKPFALSMLALLLVPALSHPQIQTESTRIDSVESHLRVGPNTYPFRQKIDFILQELDIQPGDHIADIGAGDGWWSERFAGELDGKGAVFALEVEQSKVDPLLEKYSGHAVIRPQLTSTDQCDLPDDSCDLIFFSQVYHHLNEGGHVGYLKGLKKIAKPTARLCIIEKYSKIAAIRRDHGTNISQLVSEAEEAGWILARYELLRGVNHYLAIFAQSELFPGAETASAEIDGQSFKTRNPELTSIFQDIVNRRAVLIDVREQKEWDAGRLHDATLVPLSEIKANKDKPGYKEELAKIIPADKTVYLHCRSGQRVNQAAPLLNELGFDVIPLQQGYQTLFEAGFSKAE